MSLLTSVNNLNNLTPSYIENIGGAGTGVGDAPCIKGTTLGTVRIGDPADGVVIRGDTVANINRIGGGQANGGTFSIGNSTASPSNIVLQDGTTIVTTPLTLNNFGVIAAGDLSTAGNLVFTGNTGKSVSGYFNGTSGPYNVGDGSTVDMDNPAGITAGWYIIAIFASGNQQECVSTVAHYTGTIWDAGGAVSSLAGSGRMAFYPSGDRSKITLANSTGVAQNGLNASFAKLLN